MPDYVLQCQNISKTYSGVRALNNMQFSLGYGEIHALIGENGAGKSTLIKIFSGIESPDAAGENTTDSGANIYIAGNKINKINSRLAIQLGISVIYQDLSLLKNLSVGENLLLGRLLEEGCFWINRKKLGEMALEILAELSLHVDTKTLVESLSVGKQQMLAIARALLLQTKILIMDEPTSALSTSEIQNLFGVMAKLKDKGISIIFVSHKLDELFSVCDRFTILRDGNYMGSFDKTQLTKQRLIQLMVGRDITYSIYDKRDKKNERVVLEAQNLSKKKHFANISFTLHKGEILGFYGMLGAGRTELMQAIFGVSKAAESGTLSINGLPIPILSPMKARQIGLAYLPEDRLSEGLFVSRTLYDNIIITADFINKFRWRLLKREKNIVQQQLDSLHILPKAPDMLAEKLSGGNKQKLVIAKWLAIEPMIMLIDEPTNGIDIAAKSQIHKTLRRLSEQGVSIIVVSSEMNEVISICDRVIVMRRGRISACLADEEIKQENIIKHAVIGL